MSTFIVRRFLHAVVVMLGVVTITFFLIHTAPGDPITRQLESTQLSHDNVERLQRQYGLDQPLSVQYLRYVGRLSTGDFGISFSENRPVLDTLIDRIPNTLLLAIAALCIDFGLGIGLGVWQGMRVGGAGDRFTSLAGLVVYATPSFWLGAMFVLAFSIQLRWLPTSGAYDPLVTHGSLITQMVDRLRHLILPAFTLGVISAAGTARFQRGAFRDTLHMPFVVAAKARGLTRTRILIHTLRNSLLPTITLVGLSLPLLLSGAVLVESVFGWPGMGSRLLDAVDARDYPVVTAGALLAALSVVLGSFVSDVTYRIVDPRTRSSG